MGLLECASYMSKIRGYDYFKEHKVRIMAQLTETQYRAAVLGSTASPYDVLIDIAHLRKSKCNCPHANGRRIVCKHMVAVYLTAFPDEAERIRKTIIADRVENEDDEWDEYDDEDAENEESNRVIEYVCNMKKSELQQTLLRVLFDGPEWQYDQFIREHGLEDDWY